MAIEALQFGQHYHIFNRGNNRENLFPQKRNYPYFLKRYAQHILPVAETYAYCLLPNHFHLAIRTRSEAEQEQYWETELQPYEERAKRFVLKEPSDGFKNLFISYTKSINKAVERTGSLFEKPFNRILVSSERYLQTLIIYIHQNPQSHGLIDDFRDWRWSSFGAFHTDLPTKIERNKVIDYFGDSDAFFSAHETGADVDVIKSLLFD